MGAQKKFRSEAARKNYEAQEKRREQAAKRKALKIRKDELLGSVRAWLKANPRKALITAISIVAAIILMWLGCKLLIGPGGSIPNFFGTLVGVQDNWLVINTAENGETPRYRHLADFEVPAGYQLSDYSAFDDELMQDFYCTPIEEGGVICDAYIAGAANMTGAEYIPTLLAYQMHLQSGEPAQATIAGKEANYIYLVFDEGDTDGEGMAYSCLCIYMDTDKDACVSAMISSYTQPLEAVPDEAALLREAETILSGLTLAQ